MSDDRLYLHQLACEVAFRIQTAENPAVALAKFCDDLADEVAAGQKNLGDSEFLRQAFRSAMGYSIRAPLEPPVAPGQLRVIEGGA